MRTDNQRKSTNFEDRGQGRGGGGGGGGLGAQLLFGAFRMLGLKGTIIVGIPVALLLVVNPGGIRESVMSMLLGGGGGGGSVSTSGKVCDTHVQACDFSARILGATEDVWRRKFAERALPSYRGAAPSTYQDPTLVVFSGQVSTGGCGNASSAVGPFYCPADRKLYIDPSFYDVMEKRLKAPGDFAQAYVLAHEVGHHVQTLIGSKSAALPGENDNQTSVRTELQADCFAGVWGAQKKNELSIDTADLAEALTAAHAIGDDNLGHGDARNFTHGSSAQRMKWFRRGFDTGDARQCDTFAERNYQQL
jgi:predicted metalloprotease